MLLPACKLLVVGRFAKGEGFFWLDDLDGIRLARRESLAVLLKKRRACPAMKRVVDVPILQHFKISRFAVSSRYEGVHRSPRGWFLGCL